VEILTLEVSWCKFKRSKSQLWKRCWFTKFTRQRTFSLIGGKLSRDRDYSISSADESTGIDVVLTDEEYKTRGATALQKNEDAINANPRVDKTYSALEKSYIVDFDPIAQLNFLQDIETIMSHPEIQLDPTVGWTYVDVRSEGKHERSKSTFVGFVSNDQKNIIVTSSIRSAATKCALARACLGELDLQIISLESLT
jgi:hypothetical protein